MLQLKRIGTFFTVDEDERWRVRLARRWRVVVFMGVGERSGGFGVTVENRGGGRQWLVMVFVAGRESFGGRGLISGGGQWWPRPGHRPDNFGIKGHRPGLKFILITQARPIMGEAMPGLFPPLMVGKEGRGGRREMWGGEFFYY